MRKLRTAITVFIIAIFTSGMFADHAWTAQKRLHIFPLKLRMADNVSLNLTDGKLSVDPFSNQNNPVISYLQNEDSKAYRAAYKNILNEKWQDAIDALEEFKKDFPKSRRLSSADYWICYSKEKLGYTAEQAFDMYEEFIEKYPTSSWVDDARSNMISLGSELIQAGNKEYEARVRNLRRDSDESLALAALYALGTDDEENVLPQVIGMYDNTGNSRIRRELVYIIARFDSDKATDKLFDIIRNDPDVEIKKTAIHHISEKGPEKFLTLATELIWNAKDAELTRAAVYALPRIKLKESQELLVDVVKNHNDADVRTAAVHMVSGNRMSDPEMIGVMENVIFDSKDIELKKTAIYALNNSKRPEKTEVFLNVLKSGEDAAVKTSAVHCLSKSDLKDPEMQKVLENIIFNAEDIELQKAAVYSLTRADEKERDVIFVHILKSHENSELQKIAIEGLSKETMQSEESIKILESILFNDSNTELQKTAIYSLSRIYTPQAVKLISDVVRNHDDPELKKAALYSIPQWSTFKTIFPALNEIIFKGSDRELQEAAIYTLARFDKEEANKLIANVITEHEDPKIKLTALYALSEGNMTDELVEDLESIALLSVNIDLQRAALNSIMNYDKKKYNEILVRLIKEKKDDSLIMGALQIPGELGPILFTIDYLENLIFSKEKSEYKEQAIYLLENKGKEEGLDVLIKVAKTHEDTKIRKAAVMALGRSKNPKAKAALLEIIKKH